MLASLSTRSISSEEEWNKEVEAHRMTPVIREDEMMNTMAYEPARDPGETENLIVSHGLHLIFL